MQEGLFVRERGNTVNGFAVYATPVGQVRIDWEDGAVVGLRAAAEFLEKGRETGLTALAAEQLRQYFAGERRSFDFPYVLRGTPFQRDVDRIVYSKAFRRKTSRREASTSLLASSFTVA